MRNYTFGIIGNDYNKTTDFVNNIILKTKVQTDQEHIKMNIVINNNILNDKLILKEILIKLEEVNTNFLCLNICNKYIYDFVKENTNIKVLNSVYDEDDSSLINKILRIEYGEEYE